MKTASEFYAFFEKIPEEKWCKGDLFNSSGQRCGIGHLIEGAKAYPLFECVSDKWKSTLDRMFQNAGFKRGAMGVNDHGPFDARRNILFALQVCSELGL